jgi:hypothetical protein
MGKQASDTHKWGGRRMYRQAVPEGIASVMLRGVEETGPWDANHAVIMSQQPDEPPRASADTPPSSPD